MLQGIRMNLSGIGSQMSLCRFCRTLSSRFPTFPPSLRNGQVRAITAVHIDQSSNFHILESHQQHEANTLLKCSAFHGHHMGIHIQNSTASVSSIHQNPVSGSLLPQKLFRHRTPQFSTGEFIIGNSSLHRTTMTSKRCFSSSNQSNLRETSEACSDAAPASDLPSEEEASARRLGEALMAGERWALAKAITVVEATHRKGKRQAQVLLKNVLNHLREKQVENRGIPHSFRIGLTGPPGAGKSTFIEALGRKLTAEGHRVAVLAVDPSSSITGGSLLGDKTRMTELSRDPNAYIRASPSSGTLGGVTRNTNDTILLCEAAGYDVILVETIGVGQSEYVVADMVDMLVLLIPPAGGDELQGLKKGIVERADFILINKADGELLIPARRIKIEYTSAVKLMYKRSPLWSTKVNQVSSKTGDGLDRAWGVMEEYRGVMQDAGELVSKRERQRRVWMWHHIQDRLMEEFRGNRLVATEARRWEEEVMAGRCTSGIAADELLRVFSTVDKKF